MSEERLKELQEYNLEYLEAQESEEMFGGDYISAVELKYAKKEVERLNNIINEFEEELEREINIKEEDTGLEHNTYIDIRNTLKAVLKNFKKLKGEDIE